MDHMKIIKVMNIIKSKNYRDGSHGVISTPNK